MAGDGECVRTRGLAGRGRRGRGIDAPGAAFLAIGLGLASVAPLLLAVVAIMGMVGLTAVFSPARRGLRVQAIEALRADG